MRRFLPALAALALVGPAAFAQGFVTPGDNLVTDGIPKVPADLAEKVGRYTEFRAAGLASWHPTRREMLAHPIETAEASE